MKSLRILIALLLAMPVVIITEDWWIKGCVWGLQIIASLDFEWGKK